LLAGIKLEMLPWLVGGIVDRIAAAWQAVFTADKPADLKIRGYLRKM
jgi:hypothetical protein